MEGESLAQTVSYERWSLRHPALILLYHKGIFCQGYLLSTTNMFTGIIPGTGTIVRVHSTKRGRFITVKVDPRIARKVPEGGSVSVEGVCLTVITRTRDTLRFELMDSTLKRTTLGARRVGDRVNIEPAMLVGQPIGGHFISGHVDGVGRVRKVATRWHTRYVVVDVPRDLHRYLVPQGSVVVNGVSLTIVEVASGSFSVALTKYTLDHTNLGDLRVGDKVNIEVDMLAKYLEQFLSRIANSK